MAGAVEFTEENPLPLAENKPTVLDEEGEGRTDQRGHEVGGRVAFSVFERIVHGYERRQAGDDVLSNRRIRSFVDGQSSGGVGIEEMDEPRAGRSRLRQFIYICRNIDQFHLSIGGY